MEEFVTIKDIFESESVIKKSRFIARLYPVRTEEEVNEILRRVKKEHYKATHVCSAYLFSGFPERMKASDDGEPSGTAGKPILDVLKRNGVKDILAVVIRYFGGIKLGAGGLIRAYAGSVADCLKQAEKIQEVIRVPVRIETEYSFYELLRRALDARHIRAVREDFSDTVALDFDIRPEELQSFTDFIQDLTQDNFLYQAGEARLIQIPYTESIELEIPDGLDE